ncbi:MAG: symmetrical bis(5'-nucleosyl)-tetraphosphatase [gamma proteobacterium symbiont of Taylorina sp.]|nr:symmetrical bis(5'-nucleosyl)-tetraphosphatase [gamma proteobacterium symbiont of Taylorina sp.]
MATYAIGDIQGCFDSLQVLLDKISFDPDKDILWFAGDLVNRGDKSLATLRYIKSLGDSAICVLGNHDLTLLALSEGNTKAKHHTLYNILAAPDREELLGWLRHRPLFYHDSQLNYAMVHAGLPPQWTLKKAKKCANEVEAILQGNDFPEFMANMFGNQPAKWAKNLKGWDRLRFITNCFTRMRYCKPKGKLNFKDKGVIGSQKKGNIPWYEVPGRKSRNDRIIFGHWSTLFGQTSHPNVYALDTGCLWGGRLTAMRLDSPEPELTAVVCDV